MNATENGTPVIIYVRGEQYYEGVDPDATELVTEGTLTETEEGFRITYEETALTGLEGTTTVFEICGGRVSLTRSGGMNTQMVFEEGKRHTSLYGTPMGDLTIDIETGYLRHNLTARGGLLEIRYTIAVEHTVTGRNSFRVRVREKL